MARSPSKKQGDRQPEGPARQPEHRDEQPGEQNDALTQSYDNQEHDMQMDWFIRGGTMVLGGILLAFSSHAALSSQRAASAG